MYEWLPKEKQGYVLYHKQASRRLYGNYIHCYWVNLCTLSMADGSVNNETLSINDAVHVIIAN